MAVKLFCIKYSDKDTAALIYRQISRLSDELGVQLYNLESYQTKSRRSKNHLKITIGVEKRLAGNIPAILKTLKYSFEDHPLWPYLSFDYVAVPVFQTEWNCDSYDDPKYQVIFIRKRKELEDE